MNDKQKAVEQDYLASVAPAPRRLTAEGVAEIRRKRKDSMGRNWYNMSGDIDSLLDHITTLEDELGQLKLEKAELLRRVEEQFWELGNSISMDKHLRQLEQSETDCRERIREAINADRRHIE